MDSMKSDLLRAANSRVMDKIPHNIAILKEKILVAQTETILVIENFQSFFAEEFFDENNFVDNMKTKSLNDSTISKISINKDYQFKGFIDLGNNESCMLLENVNTFQIRFLKPIETDMEEIEFK